jgi:hypothetical protein
MMTKGNLEIDPFSKFIEALDPWLDQMVLVGGWAHRLHRLDSRARQLDYVPLTTLDGDVAVPTKLKEAKRTVRERLLSAGFKEEFVGDDRPPATHYHYGEAGGFYAEFLTPLVGSEYDRGGKRRATKEVGGVSSQRLRYIEILLISPWKIEPGGSERVSLSASEEDTSRQSNGLSGPKNSDPSRTRLPGPCQRPCLYA